MRWILTLTLYSTLLSACPFSMVEQDGRYLLLKKRLGDLPTTEEKLDKPLNLRGLQEVKVKDASGEVREARVRVIYDSKNKEEIERIVSSRCAK